MRRCRLGLGAHRINRRAALARPRGGDRQPPGKLTLNRSQNENRNSGRGRRRQRRGPNGERRDPIHLTSEGVPSATPDAPKPSPVVLVSDESRVRYPWLPGRVIAGSVWRGPRHERIQVDETGHAAPWRSGPGTAREHRSADPE